ncbi:glycoside hydrolase family 13 [Flavihumibacter sp. UBA7668]|uniref:glycoside hydrolase family 13 n=1 Tax=Flavihumibacter sp. UBA7668 TaxID=1946542 RepID=UPI0025C2A6D9|nr:glycoside hydrolase family 13 [Flavihumibacter sp. UBA7668]
MSTKVTFTLSPEIVGNATEAVLVGDFNNWNPNEAIGLKVQKDGSLKATVALEPGQTYQYRYLLNDGRWVNDGNADYYSFDPVFHVDNCVITVPVKKTATKKTTDKAADEAASSETTTTDAPASSKPEDLTKIEGIGKKIAELLQTAGIAGFQDLSKATPKKLKTILDAAGSKFKVHDPATWPKQAKLAAAGKWEELKKLQKELKGGK